MTRPGVELSLGRSESPSETLSGSGVGSGVGSGFGAAALQRGRDGARVNVVRSARGRREDRPGVVPFAAVIVHRARDRIALRITHCVDNRVRHGAAGGRRSERGGAVFRSRFRGQAGLPFRDGYISSSRFLSLFPPATNKVGGPT